MKKIILNKFENSLFNLDLLNGDEFMGNLSVYLDRRQQAWLHLYIDEKWRCRWLTKTFGGFLLKTLIQVSKEYDLDIIFTKLNNSKSLRLLNFFGFKKHNENYYYLAI